MTSPFAPPTGPPEIGPVPSASSPGDGRRRPLARVAALAATMFAVAALGVAAFTVLADEGSDDGAGVAEPFSLVAAAESTITARAVEFDLTVSAAGLADVTVSGAVDNESALVSLSADLSALALLGESPLPVGVGEVTLLIDGAAGVVYVDADALGGLLPVGADWVSIDLGELGALAELGELGEFGDGLALDPVAIARLLLDTGDAVEIGVDVIDGVEVRHHRVTVDANDLELPDAELPEIELPDTVVYDVWVTAENQLRRVAIDTEVAGSMISLQLDVRAGTEPPGIELPAESDVVDVTGLLGS